MRVDSTYLMQRFPALEHLSQIAKQQFLSQASIQHYNAGDRLFHEGMICDRFLLLLEGRLLIQKMTADGHEIVLYHLDPGLSCFLTDSCLLGGQCYPAEAVAETSIEILSTPKTTFMEVFNDSIEFRREIYVHINSAIHNLVNLVEDLAFGHLNHRLALLLFDLSRKNNRPRITHQELAVELGTAREVISRLLKEFESNGWLKLHRGYIEIINREKLENL